MGPTELHAALSKIHPRSAQILTHRLLENRPDEACAELYGLTLPQWQTLYARAAAEFPGDVAELAEHREAVKQLVHQAAVDYEASPRYRTENLLRRIAIVVIIALSAYFYWREEQRKNAPHPRAVPTTPR